MVSRLVALAWYSACITLKIRYTARKYVNAETADQFLLHENSTPESRDFGLDDLVTPSRDRRDNETPRRQTDASKLTFPLQLVIVIIGGIIATTGAFWISTSQIRSDVRDMATQQREEQRVRDVERKLADERYESLKSAISAVTSAQRLEEIRNQEMRVSIAQMGTASGGKK